MPATDVTFEPGVYTDMPEDDYHADPVPGGSLSSSGARKLLPPGCPAKYRYELGHPPERSAVLELGTAAHSLVLGKGKPLAWLEADDWRTKAAREWREAARAEGSVPLLKAEHEQIQAMAAAIREHPLAGPLLADQEAAEHSCFWQDPEFGIWRRARLDSHRHGSGRLIVTDYKTTACAEPDAFARSVANYGYHAQASWYLDAIGACLGEADAAFLLVAQEKAPPYLVTVAGLDAAALRAGDAVNRRAMEIYRDCQESDHWPGYQADGEISYLSLPPWALREDYR